MNIPDFPLPSNTETVIKFRVPTVSDCLSFAELDPAYEEQITTQYLNHIQNGEVNDAGNWTGEDRRTALWWIFISTREDKSIAFSYKCSLCDETHYPVIDMASIGLTATSMNGEPFRVIDFSSQGGPYKATVHPLSGYSLEQLEQLKNERNSHQQDTANYRKAANTLSLYEMLHSFDVDGQPTNQNEALEYKKTLVGKMTIDNEFRPFAANIEISLRTMRHGLLTKYQDAGYLLLASREPCAKEDGLQPILLPFRCGLFIPHL